MIDILKPDECCGCTACANVCSHQAISMKPDGLGFLYPSIDKDKCTNCGLCETVCAFNNHYDTTTNFPQPYAYAARHKDFKEIAASQSGGAFAFLSDYILEHGGVVYGVGYGEHFRVMHKRATTKEERNEFRGSKYVQSDLNNVFMQIKNDLRNGMTVLFSGTPCQTAGLNSFIGKKLRENLFLIDIICHGVPAPGVWQDYLLYLENKNNKKITKVNFRDKSIKGWRSHIESYCFDNTYTNTYTNTFYSHIMLRHSCGSCHFTNLRRPSDITVGDFWGIENTPAASMAEDNKGCSLILVNTDRGKFIFENVKDRIQYMQVSIEQCIQPNLKSPSILPANRIEFESDYIKYGFKKTLTKYRFIGWRRDLRKCFSNIPYPLKQIIKKLIER